MRYGVAMEERNMSMVRGSWRALWVVAGVLGAWAGAAQGAKLADVRVVDDEHIQVHLLDGEVEWKDTGTGPTAFHGGCDSAGEVIHKFNPPVDTAAAVKVGELHAFKPRRQELPGGAESDGGVPQEQGERDRPRLAQLQLHDRAHDLPGAAEEDATRGEVHAEDRPWSGQRHGGQGFHVRYLFERVRGDSRQPHRVQPGDHGGQVG